jgi:hypothetical protein
VKNKLIDKITKRTKKLEITKLVINESEVDASIKALHNERSKDNHDQISMMLNFSFQNVKKRNW